MQHPKTGPATASGIRYAALLLCLLAAIAAAFFLLETAHAQESDNDYVDVAVMLEVPDTIQGSLNHDLNIIVVNRGSRTAYDVEVVVNVVSPEQSHFRAESQPIATRNTVSLENDGRTLRWPIPVLGGLQREQINAHVTHETVSPQTPLFDNSASPHELFGQVTTSSFETDLHKGNNTDRVWSYNYLENQDSFRDVLGNYSVSVAVDNPSPSPGGYRQFHHHRR